MDTPRRKATEGKAPEPSSTAARAVALDVSEKDFQQQIIDLARLNKWMVYHTADSRRSYPGFPDLVMVRGAVCIFLELKSVKGKATVQQQEWIDRLQKVRIVHADIARPHNWDDVRRALTARAR